MSGPGGGKGRSERPPGPKSGPPPSLGEYAGAGLQLAMSIVAFMFLGVWLDKTLGSSPWFVLICVFLGAGAGFYSIYRKLMASGKRDDIARKRGAESREDR